MLYEVITVAGESVVDLSYVAPDLPTDMKSLLELGASGIERARSAQALTAEGTHALSEVKLEAPVMNPSTYLAIGMNYRDHVEDVITSYSIHYTKLYETPMR